MSKKYSENQVKAMLQLSILYDVQESVRKVSDDPIPTRTKPLAEWVKSEYPELHKKFGLDEIFSFGKLKAPTWNPEAFRKLDMDLLPRDRNGGFTSPTFHPESFDAIGLKGIKTDSRGKISPIEFQGDFLDRLERGSKPPTLRERFQGAEVDKPIPSIRERFQVPEEGNPTRTLRERFQVPEASP